MKLIDLEPKWCSAAEEFISDVNGNPLPIREKIGLFCNCPKCGASHPLLLPFANPFDGGKLIYSVAWQRTGNTFETLTLTPSIFRKDCGWHGYITNGEIVNV